MRPDPDGASWRLRKGWGVNKGTVRERFQGEHNQVGSPPHTRKGWNGNDIMISRSKTPHEERGKRSDDTITKEHIREGEDKMFVMRGGGTVQIHPKMTSLPISGPSVPKEQLISCMIGCPSRVLLPTPGHRKNIIYPSCPSRVPTLSISGPILPKKAARPGSQQCPSRGPVRGPTRGLNLGLNIVFYLLYPMTSPSRF